MYIVGYGSVGATIKVNSNWLLNDFGVPACFLHVFDGGCGIW
jgi:hypothetical protein